MSVKTPGSLGLLQYLDEESYGIVSYPATAQGYGFMRTATADQSREITDMGGDGTRKTVMGISGIREATLSAELTLYRISERMDWSHLLKNAVREIPTSETLLVKTASDEYFQLTGAVPDKLTLSADNVGSIIIAKADFKGQKLIGPKESTAEFGEIHEVPHYDRTPITFNAYPYLVFEDGTEEIIPTHKFTYTINNSLVAQQGILDDGIGYAAGNGLVPGMQTATLEFEVTSKDNIWDERKLNGFEVVQIRHKINDIIIGFTNCQLQSGLPARSQNVYNETLTFKCHGAIHL